MSIRRHARRFSLFTTIMAVMLLALAGCNGLQKPTAEVTRMAITDQSGEGARLELTLNIDNPNDVALPVRAAKYRVDLEGAGEFQMTDMPAVSLPPNGTQEVVLAASFAGERGGWRDRFCRIDGQLEYQPPGQIRELLTQYNVPLPAVPFEASSRLQQIGE